MELRIRNRITNQDMLIMIPLVLLAVFSLLGGFIEMPHNLAHIRLFSSFLHHALPAASLTLEDHSLEWMLQGISALLTLGGLFIAYQLYIKSRKIPHRWAQHYSRAGCFLMQGWKFDRLYEIMVIRPVTYLSEINKWDFIDRIYLFMAGSAQWWHNILVKTQNGRVRWYIMGTALGILLILAIINFLWFF
jgi:NADH-quinone oxidoreductase subunit L